MQDDKFDELMNRYVDSTKRGKDVDFQKLKAKEDVEVKSYRKVPKYVWGVCAVALVLIVSLSIVLPIVLNKETPPDYFYCDDSLLNNTQLDDINLLNEEYAFECILPTVEPMPMSEPYLYVMSLKSDNNVVGAFITIAVFDEYFDDIDFNVIKKPYALNELAYFNAFTDSVTWRNTTVKYLIADYDEDEYYSYALTFSLGNNNYFISFKSYTIMTATEVLDLIYQEK